MFPHLWPASPPAARVLAETFYRVQWKPCPSCGRPWNDLGDTGWCPECEDEEVLRGETQFKLGKLLVRCLGRYGVENYRLDRFEESAGNLDALRACQTFDPIKDNLFMYGLCGSGKTHLAGAVFRSFVAAWKGAVMPAVAFLNPPMLMRQMRGLTPDEENDRIDRWANCEIFILDDLGVGRATEFSIQVLYEIINKRNSNKRNGLIVTSNLHLDRLGKAFGDDRLPSRMAGMCRIINVIAQDRRLRPEIRESLIPAPTPIQNRNLEPPGLFQP